MPRAGLRPPAAHPFALWRDARGRLSWLRAAALGLLLWPILLAIAAALGEGGLGPRPVNNLIHRAGFWALMFLLVSLAITPLRRVTGFGRLIDVRRMIGVGAFCYAAAHVSLYALDLHFDLIKLVTEIASRVYLIVGLTALTGLAILAATSTDGMVRRLGGARWRRLHQASYVIALLALVHFFQQTKLDATIPTLVAGLFAWLMAYRIVAARRGSGALSAAGLAGLAIAVAALTFLGEAVGIGLAYHASPLLVLQAAFDFDLAIRPGWFVLAAGLAVAALDLLTRWRRAA